MSVLFGCERAVVVAVMLVASCDQGEGLGNVRNGVSWPILPLRVVARRRGCGWVRGGVAVGGSVAAAV